MVGAKTSIERQLARLARENKAIFGYLWGWLVCASKSQKSKDSKWVRNIDSTSISQEVLEQRLGATGKLTMKMGIDYWEPSVGGRVYGQIRSSRILSVDLSRFSFTSEVWNAWVDERLRANESPLAPRKNPGLQLPWIPSADARQATKGHLSDAPRNAYTLTCRY